MNAPSSGDVASPCVGVCQLTPGTRLCTGCLRTIGEITEWRAASAARRREILAAIDERRSSEGSAGSRVSP